jgi:hypothetical protein
VAQRREMIWVDGRRLRPIETERYDWVDPDGRRFGDTANPDQTSRPNDPGRLVFREFHPKGLDVLDAPYTFAVWDRDDAPEALRDRIFVRLPVGMDLRRSASIEVPLLAQSQQPLFRFRGKRGLILRNLSFTRAGGGFLAPALGLVQCENVLLEECAFNENEGPGLIFDRVKRLTVRRCIARENGQKGIGGNGRDLLLEDCDTSWNNVRGAWAGFIGWDSAAVKLGESHNVTFRRHVAVGNQTGGIWIDVFCTNILVDRGFIFGNERPGLEFEYSRPDSGGYVVRDSVLARNRTCGLFVSDVVDTVAENCLIVDNGPGRLEAEISAVQVALKNQTPRGPDTAAQWKRLLLRKCVIAAGPLAPEGTKLIGYQNDKTRPEAYTALLRLLSLEDCIFWHPSDMAAFEMPGGAYADLRAWQEFILPLTENSITGRDSVPPWKDPGFGAPGEPPDFTADSQSGLTRRARALGIPLPTRDVLRFHQQASPSAAAPEEK